MKIGVLAYQSAINFGANLQIASTYGYLKKQGLNPIIINLIPSDLAKFYSTNQTEQIRVHFDFVSTYCTLTQECHNAEEVADVIKEEGIDAVIIGSDAVAQHHPLLERIVFPTRRIFHINKLTSDRMFPNPFWGTFSNYLPTNFPMAILSASCQDSSYKFIGCRTLKQMKACLNKMSYISARDTWTKSMYEHIYHKQKEIPVTPDPVFAFNNNIDNIPTENEIREKYNLDREYILISFLNSTTVNKTWLDEFQMIANRKNIDCVALPFPSGIKFENNISKQVSLPLSPIDWYSLIKYSKGYVGHNMHPIVVSLHNAVPFFSFDNYGRKINRYKCDESTSKIKHILYKADMLDYRISCCNGICEEIAPSYVLQKLMNFDSNKAFNFAKKQYAEYENMMKNILYSFENK